MEERPIALWGALGANAAIAVTKFAAAFASGSSALLAEGFHSLADTGNEVLLLIGLKRSKRPPDRTHPFGHGRELYFWSLVVAMLLFGMGGGVSFYEGYQRLVSGHGGVRGYWAFVVLAFAFVFEGVSFGIALRQFLPTARGGFVAALRASKDSSLVTVLCEDAAALVGVVIAFVGAYLSRRLDSPVPDGIASLIIGVVLACVAIFLAYESHGPAGGRVRARAGRRQRAQIVETDPAVETSGPPLTMHLGPSDVLLNLEVHFHRDLTAPQVGVAIDRLEKAIRQAHPEIRRIFIEAESLRDMEKRRRE